MAEDPSSPPKKLNHPVLRRAKFWYLKVLRQEGTPEAIARGWACGVFTGCFPLFGLQMLLGLLLATILQGNKFTAAAGTWISNPLTYVPIYYFNFHVGQIVLQKPVTFDEAQLQSWSDMGVAGVHVVATLFLGCSVVGGTLGIGTYFLSLALTARWRSLKQKKAERQAKDS
ncbi:MAG: DUF2062 domain-containing protein [Limnothrix sp. RL_2_0]|nr:DUF2062 domain-containing protein [Limnothrix sp. RL_2_0]